MTREERREEARAWSVFIASLCGVALVAYALLVVAWWACHREDRRESAREFYGEDNIVIGGGR